MSVSLLTTPFGSATQLASGLFLAMGDGNAAGFLADGTFAQVAGMAAARDEVLGAELSHILAEAQTTGNGRGSEMARSEFTKILSGGAKGDATAPAQTQPLDHVNARLADEHARAGWLEEGLYKIGIPYDDRASILAKAQNLRQLRLTPESGGVGGFGAVLKSGPDGIDAVEITLPRGLKVVSDDILQMLTVRALYDASQPSASKPAMAAAEEVDRLKKSLEMSGFERIARIVTDGGPKVLCNVAEGITAANPFWGAIIFIDAARAYASVGGEDSTFYTWFGAAQTIDRAGHPARMMQTSLTTQYQQETWGLERIGLDGIQNHLPADSGGTRFSIEFYVPGNGWMGFDRRKDFIPGDVRRIRFSDDGKGYDPELLSLLYSTKTDDPDSVGEKGEGLKLMITACIRNGIRVTLESTYMDSATGEAVSWRAVPFTRGKKIGAENLRQLHFRVEETGRTKGVRETGSKTTFDMPPVELTQFMQNEMERKVLALRPGFTPLYRDDEAGDVLDDSGWVFVKGVYITDSLTRQLGFGYNFTTVSPNRDRDNVNQVEILYGLRRILEDLRDEEIIKALIKKGADGNDLLEFSVLTRSYNLRTNPATRQREIVPGEEYGSHLGTGDIWKKCFQDLYGDKAMLSSDDGKDHIARLGGHTVVKVPWGLSLFLSRAGVLSSNDLQVDATSILLRDERDIESVKTGGFKTSWTQDMGRTPLDEEMVLKNILQNHQDANGGEPADIEYFVPVGVDYNGSTKFGWKKFNGNDDAPLMVEAVRISNRGRGYSQVTLGLAFTTKPADASEDNAGGFGEGTKLAALAVLNMARKSGLAMKLRSGGWAATPVELEVSEDAIRTRQLCFLTAEGLFPIDGSQTTIYNPNTAMLDILRRLGRYALRHNPDYRPIHETGEGAIFDPSEYSPENRIERNEIFVRAFRVTGAHHDRLIASYNLNLGIRDISPDRNDVKLGSLASAIEAIIGACTDPEIITKIVQAAEHDQEKFEFVKLDFKDADDPRVLVWREAFRTVYGEKAVLASGNPAIAMEAIHLGYAPVSLDPKIRETLHNAGIETDREKIGEGLECAVVPREELTGAEREMLDLIPKLDEAIFVARPERSPTPAIVVYSRAWTKGGEERDGVIGFYKRKTDTIYIKRDQLAKIKDFATTYVHERGHQQTGAADAEDAFREFFEDLAWLYVGAHIGGRSSFTDELSEMAAKLSAAQAKERIFNAHAALLRDAREQLALQEAAIRSIAGGLAMYMPADERPDFDKMPVDRILTFISSRTGKKFMWRRGK